MYLISESIITVEVHLFGSVWFMVRVKFWDQRESFFLRNVERLWMFRNKLCFKLFLGLNPFVLVSQFENSWKSRLMSLLSWRAVHSSTVIGELSLFIPIILVLSAMKPWVVNFICLEFTTLFSSFRLRYKNSLDAKNYLNIYVVLLLHMVTLILVYTITIGKVFQTH